MDLVERLEAVRTLDDFVEFVRALSDDQIRASLLERGVFGEQGDWQHSTIGAYLEAIAGYVQDALLKDKPSDMSWKFIAELLYAGKIYE
jgi:hypothetical protein